jgi:nicotinamidase-related amidase
MKKAKTLPALVLVDIQKGFNDPSWGARSNRRFERNVIALLRHWRAEGAHVSHVQHVSRDKLSPLRPHQAGVEFMEFAIPRPNERVFQKSVNSAFIGTSLEGSLHRPAPVCWIDDRSLCFNFGTYGCELRLSG